MLSGAYYYFWLSNRLLFNYRHPLKISASSSLALEEKYKINNLKADSVLEVKVTQSFGKCTGCCYFL